MPRVLIAGAGPAGLCAASVLAEAGIAVTVLEAEPRLPENLRASTFLGNEFFYEIVLNGAMKDAGMAAFKSVLDRKDADAIRAYLIQRANEDKADNKTASTK